MSHIIHQQYLHVAFNGTEQEGLRFQQRLPAVCHDHLIPALERTLEKFAPDRGHWRLEQLTIDLAPLSSDSTGNDWEKALEQALTQILSQLASPDSNMLQTHNTATSEISATYQSEADSLHNAFLYFLTTGALPWHFHLKQGETLEQRLLACWQIAAEADKYGTLSPADQQTLVRLLRSASVRQRLHWQFSDPLRQHLLKQVAPDYLETLLQILQTLSTTHIPTAVFQTFSSTLWKNAFQRLSQHQQPDAILLLVDTIYQLQNVDFDQESRYNSLFEAIAQHWPLVFQSGRVGVATRNQPETVVAESGSLSNAEISHTEQNTQAVVHTAQEVAMTYTETVVSETATPYQKYAIQKTDSLYTEQAGLVLLHPFLPRFFTTLGIGDEAQLLQAERAPGLLYFLATGQTLAPEYELLLPKVLCNLPLDAPLPADIGITQSEQDEATALLQAVIHHWSVLRNTTPDGLRGNFLSRLGKLSPYPDGGWLLQVEIQTHDILLNQLPWGIGMIKLPWMRYLLRVEWST